MFLLAPRPIAITLFLSKYRTCTTYSLPVSRRTSSPTCPAKQSSLCALLSAADRRRLRANRVLELEPIRRAAIAGDYSRASQFFLFARLIVSEHHFNHPDAGVRRVSGRGS